MDIIKDLNTPTKTTFGLGLLLLVYGILSRLIPINFFWESQSIGWFLILLGLIGVLLRGIQKRKAKYQKTVWNKIGVGIISFILLIQAILVVLIPNSDAYQTSKEFILKNKELKALVGDIQGFGLIPLGGISIKSDSNGNSGNATINLIIKGSKAYKSVTVYVFKEYNKDWEVYGIE